MSVKFDVLRYADVPHQLRTEWEEYYFDGRYHYADRVMMMHDDLDRVKKKCDQKFAALNLEHEQSRLGVSHLIN